MTITACDHCPFHTEVFRDDPRCTLADEPNSRSKRAREILKTQPPPAWCPLRTNPITLEVLP